MSASLPRAESLGLCKRRRVEVQSNEGCRDAVATAFFQDNVEAEVDDEAFGASGVTVPGAVDDNDREQAEEAEEAEGAEEAEAEAEAEQQGEELGDFEIGEADPDELLALDLGEALVEEEEEEIEVTEDVLDEAFDEIVDELDGIDGDIQPPHTPEETPEDSPELHQPMHRTCPCPERSSLRGAQGNGARRKVSFAEGQYVAGGYLLDDPTGLKELIHVENFRFQDLWYSNPGAAVQCGWCQRDWPQAYGKLYGDENRSQFAQTDFVCNGCLMAAEEAFRMSQKAQANTSANTSASAQASEASASSEAQKMKESPPSAQSEASATQIGRAHV